MSEYFTDFIKWPNLLNLHIFDKPVLEAKPRSLMNKIDELIMDMRPYRDNFPWDVEIIEHNVETIESTEGSQNEIYNKQSDTGLYDVESSEFKLDLNLSDLSPKDDIHVFDYGIVRNIDISDSFLNNLSPHWLVEIIRAQQEILKKCNFEKKAAESVCTELSSHYELETPLSQKYPTSIPTRKLKKTYSEPSHRLPRKTRNIRNELGAIQSMDVVRQIDKVPIKRRNNCIKRNIAKPRCVIVDKEPQTENKIIEKRDPTMSRISSSNKTLSSSTETKSDIESEKTSASKVINWLERLPKNHQGIKNARKMGKCVKEKPRWLF